MLMIKENLKQESIRNVLNWISNIMLSHRSGVNHSAKGVEPYDSR
uniref:Uncharacterized protein n=1 Tax=Arundo donax TaxID=35708 RepID=A0A0A9E4K1_ARUDO